MENNYCKVIEQTDEEKLKMYMKCTKEELAKMLIEANRYLGQLKRIEYIPYPVYPYVPQVPAYPYPVWEPYRWTSTGEANYGDTHKKIS